MKSNNTSKIIDFLCFFGVAMAVLLIVSTATNTFKDPFSVILLILILIPTIIALISGAPFVPTPIVRVKKLLSLAKIKKGEKVYDIGCGDGRMVYLAAKEYGANAVGFELSPLVFCLAKIRQFFWKSKAKIIFTDFRYQNLSDADVVVCYLLPEPLAKLQTKLEKELKKGARVVSYAFQIGTWKPTYMEDKDPENNFAKIWVYER